jgi:hypothetical protein
VPRTVARHVPLRARVELPCVGGRGAAGWGRTSLTRRAEEGWCAGDPREHHHLPGQPGAVHGRRQLQARAAQRLHARAQGHLPAHARRRHDHAGGYGSVLRRSGGSHAHHPRGAQPSRSSSTASFTLTPTPRHAPRAPTASPVVRPRSRGRVRLHGAKADRHRRRIGCGRETTPSAEAPLMAVVEQRRVPLARDTPPAGQYG